MSRREAKSSALPGWPRPARAPISDVVSSVPVQESRCPRRRLPPGGARPSSLLAAFFAAGLISLLAGAVAAIVHAVEGGYWSHWVSLHLLFLGGVSQLVLGAGQFFVCAFLATNPPGRRMVGAQLAAWNVGTVLVAVGIPGSREALVDAGGALIVAGLVLFVAAMVGMERRSLQQARWAVRLYEAAAGALAVGAVLGVLMARGTAWTHGSLLGASRAEPRRLVRHRDRRDDAHVLSVTDADAARAPARAERQCSGRPGSRSSRSVRRSTAGRCSPAAGSACSVRGCCSAAPWPRRCARRRGPLALAARLLAVAHAFLPAGLLLALVATIADGPGGPFAGAARPALAALLVAGWVGLTVAGSLMHLLAVLGRVRDLRRPLPTPPRPLRDRALTTALAVGVAGSALAHLDGLGWLSAPAIVVLLAAGVVMAARVIALAARALPSWKPRTSGT